MLPGCAHGHSPWSAAGTHASHQAPRDRVPASPEMACCQGRRRQSPPACCSAPCGRCKACPSADPHGRKMTPRHTTPPASRHRTTHRRRRHHLLLADIRQRHLLNRTPLAVQRTRHMLHTARRRTHAAQTPQLMRQTTRRDLRQQGQRNVGRRCRHRPGRHARTRIQRTELTRPAAAAATALVADRTRRGGHFGALRRR